jgi:xylose isomerase
MSEFFTDVADRVAPAGGGTGNGLAFRVYDPDRIAAGKRREDHLPIAVCCWHSVTWPGSDVFGAGTFDRPWLDPGREPMEAAHAEQDAASEFSAKLGVPFHGFHDVGMAPPGETLKASRANLDRLVDRAAEEMSETGVGLPWGTANLVSHPRYAAGAATNPDPEVFAHAATQVRDALEATHRLDGADDVLWGGREGYKTLLDTRLRREAEQLARFLELVANHKRDLGFTGTLLIEPEPQEPTKHRYDDDCATVHGFLDRSDLFHGPIGAIDTLAQALLVADALLTQGVLEDARHQRYAAWDGDLGQHLMDPGTAMRGLADWAADADLDPAPVSGRQELLENEVNRVIWSTAGNARAGRR